MKDGQKLWAGGQLGRRARWAVPAGAVLAVGAVVAGTSLAAGAQASPTLPVRTAAQLLADAQQVTAPGPMTATVAETANLGLPSIPGVSDSAAGGSGPASGLALLTGTHTFNVWYADPAHVRIAEPVQLGESDLRQDGRQIWLWSSKTQTATHVVLPARQPRPGSSRLGQRSAQRPDTAVPTPEQAARQVLAAVGPTTTVSVQRNIRIAGQDAYQLAVAPKDSRSLIGQIRIAIDASKYLALRLQVFARGASRPAFQVGFTALSFGRPAASNFSFTPPAGAKVKTIKVPARPATATGAVRSVAGKRRAATASGSRATGKASGSLYSVSDGGWPPAGHTSSYGFLPFASLTTVGRPTVVGKDWLSVLVFPAGSVPVTMFSASPSGSNQIPHMMLREVKIPVVKGSATGHRVAVARTTVGRSGHVNHTVFFVRAASGTATYSSTLSASSARPATQGPGSPMILVGSSPAALRVLLRAATPVHGTWGSGRLLRTSLFSVLLTSKGSLLVGAVTPSVLYGDAAAVK
jgi:hypothetical protein